jgi:hypothetical protein
MTSVTDSNAPEWTYPTRQCRLCFEECEATVELPPAGSASTSARVRYFSAEDPSLGQLISPCNCAGSARFIHEGCLDAWRKNATQKKHFWECNTCHYQYQFSRLGWARLLENQTGHVFVTLMVALFLVFVFGYVADPIINLYIDPSSATSASRLWTPIKVSDTGDESSWLQHFYKGLASLGVLSFARVLLMANPWHWYNLRNSGLTHGTARPGVTGQDRVANISWIVLFIGVMTFLYTVFKTMNSLTRWFLEKAAFNIKEVHHADDDADIRPAAATAPTDDPVPPRDSPEDKEIIDPTMEDGFSFPDGDTAATSSAEARPSGHTPSKRTGRMIPGAFESGSWSFSRLD